MAKATKQVPAAPVAPPTARRFTRSRSDKWIAGVAGGLARYFALDVRLMRILTFVLCLTGAGLLAYILIWIFVPQE
jgi:phage shock protein PspC (stress-responsive transcriptional regulator)